MKKVFLAVLTVGMLSLTSCGGEAKKGTDAVKEAADKAGEAVKETADKAAEATKEAADKAGEAVKEAADKAGEAVADAVSPKVAKGKELFAAKGCVACHKEQDKLVGPALKEIAKVYAEKKGNMVKFLKEEADAIVDPAQFPMMKANLAITKALSGEELAALTSYIRSVK